MHRMVSLLPALLAALTLSAAGEFTITNNSRRLEIREYDQPVLVYNYMPVSGPEGAPEGLERSCYIHPLYGLDGDVLTEDWPADHYHHRGVFWAWPWCRVGERRMDLWLSRDARQHFDTWLERKTEADRAEVAVQNVWKFDDAPDRPVVRETVRFVVYARDEAGRAIDFELAFTNIAGESVVIQGQQDASKGYGGFSFRPDAKRAPLTFTSAQGVHPEDAFRVDSAWVDVSSRTAAGGAVSGAAIFQHPANPAYPHSGWLIRHYGFLGASWPHTGAHTIAPGETLTLRYRLYVHRGTAEEAGVAARFKEFEAAAKQESAGS